MKTSYLYYTGERFRCGGGEREELKWRQLKTKLISSQDLILVQAVQLKPAVKAQISGRMASIGINDVVSASVYSEKTRMKKLMMKMIIESERA